MPDTELRKLPRSRKFNLIDLLHIPRHPIAHLIDQLFHLGLRAFHHQLDPAVGEILYVAANIVAKGDVFHRISESDSLDVAGEIAGLAM